MRQKLHGKTKQSFFHGEIEIQTYVMTYMFPRKLTEESIELKQAIIDCTRKEVFRTSLIQSYINEDWQNFAQKYAYIEFGFYFSFVTLVMIQFWQASIDEAYMGPVFPFLTAFTPTLTAMILIINLLKEIFQMVTERKDYF